MGDTPEQSEGVPLHSLRLFGNERDWGTPKPPSGERPCTQGQYILGNCQAVWDVGADPRVCPARIENLRSKRADTWVCPYCSSNPE